MQTPFAALSAGAALFFAVACSRPPYKPIASVRQLMDATVHPAAEVIFDSVGTIISASGTEEIAPRNDEEWANVRRNALTLAEAGNLLMMEKRAKDKGEWMKRAETLVDAGTVAMKAAELKNAEALFAAGGQVYEACLHCHDRYRKEAAPIEGR